MKNKKDYPQENEEQELITIVLKRSIARSSEDTETIRTFIGNQGERGICPKSLERLEQIYKEFLSSNDRTAEFTFVNDRPLKFPLYSELKKNNNNVIPFKKDSSGAIAIDPKVNIAKRDNPTNKKVKKKVSATGLTIAILTGILFLGALNLQSKNIFLTQDENLKPKTTTSVLAEIDLNNYQKNDAISDLLSFDRNITKLTVSPNGKTIIVAADRRLFVSDLTTFSNLQTYDLKEIKKITALAISAEGSIAIGSERGKIVILTPNGQKIAEFSQSYQIKTLAFTSDNKNIISGDLSGNLQSFSLLLRKEPVSFFGHAGAINDIKVAGDLLFSASSDNTIRVWNLQGKQLKLIKDIDEIFSLAIDAKSNYIFSGNGQGTIRKWSLFTTEEIDSFTWHSQKVSSLAISDRLLISGSNDRNIIILDLKDFHNKITLPEHQSYINSVAITPEGKIVFSASDRNVIAWQKYHD